MEESVGRLGRNDLDLSAASESDTALGAAASAVAIIDRSRLRRECLKLALAQHNPHWHIAEFATADELLRIVAASEQFDKVLIGALDLVLAGGVYVPSSLIEVPTRQSGLDNGAEAPAEPWSELTRRQRDVLGLISQGKSNKLIADALAMSESTVKAHVKQIIKRLRSEE